MKASFETTSKGLPVFQRLSRSPIAHHFEEIVSDGMIQSHPSLLGRKAEAEASFRNEPQRRTPLSVGCYIGFAFRVESLKF